MGNFVESKRFIAQVSILGAWYKIFDLYVVSKDFPCSNAFVITPENVIPSCNNTQGGGCLREARSKTSARRLHLKGMFHLQ